MSWLEIVLLIVVVIWFLFTIILTCIIGMNDYLSFRRYWLFYVLSILCPLFFLWIITYSYIGENDKSNKLLVEVYKLKDYIESISKQGDSNE